jgi:hypothetical protein
VVQSEGSLTPFEMTDPVLRCHSGRMRGIFPHGTLRNELQLNHYQSWDRKADEYAFSSPVKFRGSPRGPLTDFSNGSAMNANAAMTETGTSDLSQANFAALKLTNNYRARRRGGRQIVSDRKVDGEIRFSAGNVKSTRRLPYVAAPGPLPCP